MPIVPPPRTQMRTRSLSAALRVATSAAILVAIVAQIFETMRYATSQGQDVSTVIGNHLSYFTVDSTAFGAIALACSGIWLAAHAKNNTNEPRWISLLMLCAGSAVVITGIVFNLLLRNDGVPDPDTLQWASEIKHVVAPLVMLIDLVLHTARTPLRWRDAALTLIFPIAWAIYTLLRGETVIDPVTGNPWWYPYGFLDPHRNSGGYPGVLMYVAGIAVALALIATLFVWLSHRKTSHER